MVVYLIPAGRDRFELYSEAPEEAPSQPDHGAGRLRRWVHNASLQWHQLVESARQGGSNGRFARWRDAIVCRISESMAEQRTLWALGHEPAATLLYPSSMDESVVRTIVTRELTRSRSHHLRWLSVDLTLFVASGVLFFVPGPNIVAYYLAFRVYGHFRSWRGAVRAMEQVSWTYAPDADLGELAPLAALSREERADRVAAIASRLNLPRLAAFFDRVAARPA